MKYFMFGFFYLFTQPLLATTMVPLNLAELAEKADLIVEVSIETKTAAWQGQRIYTTSKAQILDTLKDQNPQRPKLIEIQSLGGVVGQIGQKVHGAAKLETGKRYVVFLIEPDPGKYFVYGMEQGVIAVQHNDQGEQIAIPGHHTWQDGQPFNLNQFRKDIKNRHENTLP